MAGTLFTYKDSNGAAQPIEPAPLVTTSKTFVKTAEGKNISTRYTIGITGTLLPTRGSPVSNGTFSANPSHENGYAATANIKVINTVVNSDLDGDTFEIEDTAGNSQVFTFSNSSTATGSTIGIQSLSIANIADKIVDSINSIGSIEIVASPNPPVVDGSGDYSIVLTQVVIGSNGNTSINVAGNHASDITYDSSFAGGVNPVITDSDKFESIERKQRAIRELFSKDGQELLIVSNDGTTVLKCYPTITSISFSEGILVDKSQYTISLTANEISTDASDKDIGIDSEFWGANLKSASDSFSINKSDEDEDVYLLTRTITAVSSIVHANETLDALGTVYAGLEPWQRAKVWVQQRIGPAGNYDILDDLKDAISNYTFAGLDIGSAAEQYKVFSKRDSETADRLVGSYTLSRTWTLSKNSVIALETYDISINSDVPNQGGAEGTNFLRGFNTVYSLRGNIQGLESSGVSKYTNAVSYYGSQVLDTGSNGAARWGKIISRINGGDTPMTSGITFTRPFSQTYSENKKNGSLNYEFSFKEWSLANTFFADININISENHDEQVVASIPIPGRTKGPIVQNIGTTKLKVKNVNGSFILLPEGDYTTDGLGLWKMSQIDKIRGEVIDLISSEPYNILGAGSQGTDWWVTAWNDSMDTLKGVYTTNMSITFKGTEGARDLDDTDFD